MCAESKLMSTYQKLINLTTVLEKKGTTDVAFSKCSIYASTSKLLRHYCIVPCVFWLSSPIVSLLVLGKK